MRDGIPYTLAEARAVLASHPMDQHHRELMQWLVERVAAADAFVRAHCELETLARKIGASAACDTMLNGEVIARHVLLEEAVLGDELLPGRRPRPPARGLL